MRQDWPLLGAGRQGLPGAEIWLGCRYSPLQRVLLVWGDEMKSLVIVFVVLGILLYAPWWFVIYSFVLAVTGTALIAFWQKYT